jgi:hypothetical protein
MRVLVLPLLFLAGCAGPTSPSAPVRAPVTPGAAAAPAVVDPPPKARGTCAEPERLVLLDAADAAAALAADPLSPPSRVEGEGDSGTLRLGSRTYSLEGSDVALVGRDGGRELFRAGLERVAGGGFEIFAAAGGKIVGVVYSRGGTRLFDPTTGALLANAERDVVVSPDGSFALDPPALGYATGKFDRADVLELDLVKRTHRRVATLPLAVDKEYADADAVPSFGVAICPSSTLYAVSFPDTKLSVVRVADGAELASVARPPRGQPAFSASGCLVAVGTSEAPPAVYRLE